MRQTVMIMAQIRASGGDLADADVKQADVESCADAVNTYWSTII